MNLDIWNCFLIIALIVSTTFRYSSADVHIDHKDENLVTDVQNRNGVVFTSISENVEPDIIRYVNEENEDQIYLQKPTKETKDEKIVYSQTKTKTDGSASWFTYATSKGSTREETRKLIKQPNDAEESINVKGTYSYVGNDGARYIFNYISDANGFRAKVLFGTKVNITEIPILEFSDRSSNINPKESKQEENGVGGRSDLLCSLVQGGCF